MPTSPKLYCALASVTSPEAQDGSELQVSTLEQTLSQASTNAGKITGMMYRSSLESMKGKEID